MSNREEVRVISNSRAMGVIVLIVLLFVFQVITFVFHKVRTSTIEEQKKELFPFNPNTISPDSLQLLGFSEKQAQSIVNYRNNGGVFRQKTDFAKMYVVDSAKYAQFAQYILLPDKIYKEGPTPKNYKKKVKHHTEAGEQFVPVKAVSHMEKRSRGEDSLFGKKVEQNRYMCNLNTADSAALVRLYGVGGYYAKKILQYRERLGGSFVNTAQLMEIEGFSKERFDKIARNIFVSKKDIKVFSIKKSDKKMLEKHPYIGPYAARGIMSYMRLKGIGSYAGGDSVCVSEQDLLKELVEERILTEENARRLEEYLLHL